MKIFLIYNELLLFIFTDDASATAFFEVFTLLSITYIFIATRSNSFKFNAHFHGFIAVNSDNSI